MLYQYNAKTEKRKEKREELRDFNGEIRKVWKKEALKWRKFCRNTTKKEVLEEK